MSGDLSHIKTCLDLQEQDVVDAVATREATRALLSHLSRVSAPNTGAAKVILVFARLATRACDWIDGDLAIELRAEGEATTIEVSTDLGGGLRERVFAPLPFRAPLAEFARAVERVPHMIAPLRVQPKGTRALLLAASQAVRLTSIPPAPIEISSDSLFVRPPSPAVPREAREAKDDVDSGWED